jgi:1-acyl-sn-glycerol-3-phosphate acyltransferase
MSRLRALCRLVALALVTGACLAILQLGLWWDALARRQPLSWRARMLGVWARACCQVIGMRIEARGGAPAPPFLLVANHLGYVDILLLAAHARGIFVARGDLAHWPILGWLTRQAGTLYLDRANPRDIPRVVQQADRALHAGVGVFLFPEGTSSDGSDVLPFKPSLLESSARLAMPVSHASLAYTTPCRCAPARLAVCWWGDMPFAPHLWELLKLPYFEARITFGEEPMRHADRKVLAAALREAVRGHFEPAHS